MQFDGEEAVRSLITLRHVILPRPPLKPAARINRSGSVNGKRKYFSVKRHQPGPGIPIPFEHIILPNGIREFSGRVQVSFGVNNDVRKPIAIILDDADIADS
jgi:hypothetical protein